MSKARGEESWPMSPIYESEEYSRAKLQELRRANLCSECGGRLDVFMDFDKNLAFLACADWRSTHHEGIEREASVYEQEGLASLNIATRREMMTQDLGREKATRLMKYEGTATLTRVQAMEILKTIWPDAPEIEQIKAAMLCARYSFNPLMKHVFLISFKRREGGEVVGEDWVTVIGIKAKRLLASRRGSYSYTDGTPRVMTEDEQKRTFGKVEPEKLWVITKGKDPATGAEAVGYGFWPKDTEPKGTGKGNSKFNMAAIRSESQFLDRLRPGEMPQGVGVIDAEYEITEVGEGGETPRLELEKKETGGKATGQVGDETPSPTKEGTEKSRKKSDVAPPAEDIKLEDVPDLSSLYKLCNLYWKMQPADVIKELGYSSQLSIEKTPWECWLEIRSVR